MKQITEKELYKHEGFNHCWAKSGKLGRCNDMVWLKFWQQPVLKMMEVNVDVVNIEGG